MGSMHDKYGCGCNQPRQTFSVNKRMPFESKPSIESSIEVAVNAMVP